MRVVFAVMPVLSVLLASSISAHAQNALTPEPQAQQAIPCGAVEKTANETADLNCRSLARIQARLAAMEAARTAPGPVIAAGTGVLAPQSITTPQLPEPGRWYSDSERR